MVGYGFLEVELWVWDCGGGVVEDGRSERGGVWLWVWDCGRGVMGLWKW